MLVGAARRRKAAIALVVSILAPCAIALDGGAAAAADCAAGGPTYTVRDGDGWFVIASRVEVSTEALLSANAATLDTALHPGAQVCLPAGADVSTACAQHATVADGDGWGSIATRAGVSVAALLAANGATAGRVIHPGQDLCLPSGATATARTSTAQAAPAAGAGGAYAVRRGDSWSRIAERSGVTLGALLSANDADAGDVLIAGRQIRLPAGATPPPPPPTWVTLDALPTQAPCWYGDTWQAPRGGGRRHQGVDIFTLPGQYVYAVADGRVRRYWDIPGRISGNAWMLTADDGSQYFYAHLSGFPPDVTSGGRVEAGQIIGWVGGTGNASAPHLHFEIRPGGGNPVNPYPILNAAGRCRSDRPYTQPSGWVPERIG